MAKCTTKFSSSKIKPYLDHSPSNFNFSIAYHSMHISYSLHSLDCNLADGEFLLIPEQGVVHDEDQEPGP
jgi:hypothetical protein